MTCLVRQLGHLAVEASGLDPVNNALQTVLDLRAQQHRSGRPRTTSNNQRAGITYIAGESPHRHSIGLKAYDATTVAEIKSRCITENLPIIHGKPMAPGATQGFVFEAPFGHHFEVHTPFARDRFAHASPCGCPAVSTRPGCSTVRTGCIETK